ncbi:MAG: response regulator [Granulosicoccus sp.]
MATILVVDDDPVILKVFKETLESQGHVVVSAMTCMEVETIFNEKSQPIDLMLTDFHLPDAKGSVNIKRARNNDSGTKIVLMSSDARAKEYAEPGVLFMQKPFSRLILEETVHSLLKSVNA